MTRQPLLLDPPVGERDDAYFGEFLEDHGQGDPLQGMNHAMLKSRIADVLEALDCTLWRCRYETESFTCALACIARSSRDACTKSGNVHGSATQRIGWSRAITVTRARGLRVGGVCA